MRASAKAVDFRKPELSAPARPVRPLLQNLGSIVMFDHHGAGHTQFTLHVSAKCVWSSGWVASATFVGASQGCVGVKAAQLVFFTKACPGVAHAMAFDAASGDFSTVVATPTEPFTPAKLLLSCNDGQERWHSPPHNLTIDVPGMFGVSNILVITRDGEVLKAATVSVCPFSSAYALAHRSPAFFLSLIDADRHRPCASE